MLLEDFQSPFRYKGNCTNSHMAHGLEDMMDAAKPVSFRTLAAAVGRDQLAEVFPQFDWSPRPRGLTMPNDYAVSYYRSTFDGKPCYYVRESGIEFVFIDNNAPGSKVRKSVTQTIMPDGTLGAIQSGGCVYSMRMVRAGLADVGQSRASTPEAKSTLLQWLKDHRIEDVIDSGDEMPLAEFLDNL